MRSALSNLRLLPSLLLLLILSVGPISGCGSSDNEEPIVHTTMAPEPPHQDSIKPKKQKAKKPDHKPQSFGKNEWVVI